ncbi:MAG: hypothetical protein ACXAE3_05320 [Candidatus Kariarchaeaceae archaeon]|jgi:hypothetical protein
MATHSPSATLDTQSNTEAFIPIGLSFLILGATIKGLVAFLGVGIAFLAIGFGKRKVTDN